MKSEDTIDELKEKDDSKDHLLETIEESKEPEKTTDKPDAEKAAEEREHTSNPLSSQTPAEGEALSPKAAPGKEPFWKTKKFRIVLISVATPLLILGLLFAIPATRYPIVGTFLKRDVTFAALDSKTHKPISDVLVTLAGQTAKTDAKGMVQFKSVSVGPEQATVHKKYYKDVTKTVHVPITKNPELVTLDLEATGRQVPVKVTNKLSGKPVNQAVISVLDTTATTNADGEAIIVLPVDKPSQKGSVKLQGYNEATVEIQVTDQKDDRNTFAVTPSGKLYFLSKRTGKINVMKSDLDGGNAQVVLAGTGKESDTETVLLAARDWRYLALKARRDSDKAKLYLIDTANDKLSVIDEGSAEFTPVGWYNEYFVYEVFRENVQYWQPKRTALKSFNAKTAKLATLDESNAEGPSDKQYASETMTNVYILDNQIVYTKEWTSYCMACDAAGLLTGKRMSIFSVKPSGEAKHVVKDFGEGSGNYINGARLYKPQEVYFWVSIDSKATFYELEGGKVSTTTSLNENSFFETFYPTYLLSPSGQKTFWYESRDGKKSLFLGDANGAQGKEVLRQSEYTPYGWYGEDYVFVSKNKSELYVLPASDPGTAKPYKVTDYHKPDADFVGYGYGYGGF